MFQINKVSEMGKRNCFHKIKLETDITLFRLNIIICDKNRNIIIENIFMQNQETTLNNILTVM